MKHSFKTLLFLILMSCSNDDNNLSTTQGENCDFNALIVSSSEGYDFNDTFSDFFTQSSRWQSVGADISLVNEEGQLTGLDPSSQALEAWKLYKTQMPYSSSWEISVDTSVPLHWNTNGGTDAQVGVGIFAGQPVSNGESSKVYECNLAAINGGPRFVQAQLIANRLGEDPIDVQNLTLNQNTETATLKIQFCSSNKMLSLFIDDTIVGVGRSIDSSGLDNWNLTETDVIDVGIMGFAENTTITTNQPTLDNFSITIY